MPIYTYWLLWEASVIGLIISARIDWRISQSLRIKREGREKYKEYEIKLRIVNVDISLTAARLWFILSETGSSLPVPKKDGSVRARRLE